MEYDGERFRLTVPVGTALSFAMGWSDLGYTQVNDTTRRIVGLLAIDTLEYTEQWREAALARACLLEKWPDCFSF